MGFLRLSDVRKAYAGTPALSGAELSVDAGEIHALMGENGAGKSTLIKILAGVVSPDAADIRLDGTTVSIESPAVAHRLGFRFIHQELNVIPTLSVAENIFAGRPYPTRAGVLVDWRKLNEAARAALAQLDIAHVDPRRKMADLPVGDRMLVRISSAFLSERAAPARLYVMDEPTAALTREEADRLFRVLRHIRGQGRSVLYVSHRIDEVVALCDRATVLRDGRTIDSGRIGEITHDDLVALMTGRTVQNAYPRPTAPPATAPALVVRGLKTSGLAPLDFKLMKGEILGLAGLSGSGQQRVLRAVFGDLPLKGGDMRLDDKPYSPRTPEAAWARGLAYVPRERRSEGLVLAWPVYANVTLAHLARNSRAGALLAPRRERALSGRLGADVRLRGTGPRQLAMELSGGNQQKVVFARAIAGRPKVLLLDEPTRGVDVGAKYDIYTLIREMTATGMAVVMVSSDLPELLGMCDRIAVMREGAITDIVPAAGLDEEDLLNRCYGRDGRAGMSEHEHRTH